MPYVLFCVIVLLDQLVKFLVSSNMQLGESIRVLGSFFCLTYVLNPGAAFGIFENAQIFFIGAGLCILVAFAAFHKALRREPAIFYYGSLSLVAGTVGNLIDRIHTGLVIDYFDFRVWPVFNIADVAIVTGVILMICSMLRNPQEEA